MPLLLVAMHLLLVAGEPPKNTDFTQPEKMLLPLWQYQSKVKYKGKERDYQFAAGSVSILLPGTRGIRLDGLRTNYPGTKLLGAKGIATTNKDATRSSWPYY